MLTQMVCPENRGLFHGAVIMSAFIRSPYQAPETAGFVAPRSMKESEDLGADFFRKPLPRAYAKRLLPSAAMLGLRQQVGRDPAYVH